MIPGGTPFMSDCSWFSGPLERRMLSEIGAKNMSFRSGATNRNQPHEYWRFAIINAQNILFFSSRYFSPFIRLNPRPDNARPIYPRFPIRNLLSLCDLDCNRTLFAV